MFWASHCPDEFDHASHCLLIVFGLSSPRVGLCDKQTGYQVRDGAVFLLEQHGPDQIESLTDTVGSYLMGILFGYVGQTSALQYVNYPSLRAVEELHLCRDS